MGATTQGVADKGSRKCFAGPAVGRFGRDDLAHGTEGIAVGGGEGASGGDAVDDATLGC